MNLVTHQRAMQIDPSLLMPPALPTFEWSPDRCKGLACDMRVRWAIEEVGQPSAPGVPSFTEMTAPDHSAPYPFFRIPDCEAGVGALFETGAAVFHIAERHAGLLPEDAAARRRAKGWMIAALNTVEPPIVDRDIATREGTWFQQRLRLAEDRVRKQLNELSEHLGDADWLDTEFTAGDLLMVAVLRRLKGSGLLGEYPNLSRYVSRGEARSAFTRAFDAQWAVL